MTGGKRVLDALERIETRYGKVFDFLQSMYRLTKRFSELSPGYAPVGKIVEWVKSSRANRRIGIILSIDF